MALSYENEWFEEGNVCRKIKEFLESRGFVVTKFNENKKMKGHDIEAEKDNKTFIFEVKGYPSVNYVIGPEKGKKKPTKPKLQAKHWFGEAIHALIKAKSKNPNVIICIGLPDDEEHTYCRLIGEIQLFTILFGLICVFVDKDGTVHSEGI